MMDDLHVAHVTPEPDQPAHALNGLCWCQPTVEEVPPEGRIFIHRRTLDSPRYELDEPATTWDQKVALGTARLAR